MASEQYQCKAELPIMDTEGAEIEQIALGSYFVDIHDLNREIKEEPIIEYGAVSRECPKNYENGTFYDHNPDSSKFEVMLRDSIEDPTAPAHFLENGNFSGLADGLAKQEVNHVDDGVILKNEGNGDSLTNNTESKTKTLKDDIDIIYADVKSEICAEEAIGKSENKLNSAADILIETEIRPNFSHELPEDSETWHQPNIEEDGTTVERNNDTRKKKSFQCLSCSKSFTKKNIYLRHERIHTGEKPYQCKICFKAFTEKYHVRRHERTHTGEKPYQCKICLKCFAEKSKLLLHERVHTGEKPFQCKIHLSRRGILRNMRDFIQRKGHFSAKFVYYHLTRRGILQNMSGFIQGKNHFSAKFVKKNLHKKAHCWIMREFIPGKNHFSAKFV